MTDLRDNTRENLMIFQRTSEAVTGGIHRGTHELTGRDRMTLAIAYTRVLPIMLLDTIQPKTNHFQSPAKGKWEM